MTLVTPEREIASFIEEQLERNEKKIINAMIHVGISCVNEARASGNYIDQTGNLRSSIGYVVMKNGRVLHKGGFQIVKSGKEGIKDGPTFIESQLSEYSKGIVLLVVAGMNYSAYVEDMGRNVLTTAELLAERIVPKMLNEVGFKKA